VVASGFGARAQWFRNLRADPYARVTLGSRGPQPVRARVLSAAEATAVLRRYAEHHPRAWARLRPILEETLGATITDAGTGLPLVALEFEPSRAG
jgi:deazaflavin-dependent oxidoreductase (nitroreductase family)